jgi:hypothetical protein
MFNKLKNVYKYKMPRHIRKLIDKQFCVAFRDELCKIFNFSLEDFEADTLFNVEITGGWTTAFGLACIKCGMKNSDMKKLYEYYDSLNCDDSDFFASDVDKIMVKNKMFLKGSIDDLISKELKLDHSEFDQCRVCGKRFLTINMTEEYDGEIDWLSYICDKCNSPEDDQNANEYYKEGIEIIKQTFKKSR